MLYAIVRTVWNLLQFTIPEICCRSDIINIPIDTITFLIFNEVLKINLPSSTSIFLKSLLDRLMANAFFIKFPIILFLVPTVFIFLYLLKSITL
jgi:hypothetical protein